MATEKTNFINVVRDKNATVNNNTKNPIEYGMDFDGTEVLKWQPGTFEAFGKLTRKNSAVLATEITNYFKQTFHELRGTNLFVNNGGIGVEMFFERNTEPLPNGKIMNLDSLVDPVTPSNKVNAFERMSVIQNRKAGKAYTLNNETKLLLAKFMYGGKNANMPNNKKVWDNPNILTEIHDPIINDPFHRGYNTERMYVRVSGLNIRAILQEMYGRDIVVKTIANEDSDTNIRSEARYEVRYIKHLANGTFILNVEQFDVAAVEKINMEENPILQNSFAGIRMY